MASQTGSAMSDILILPGIGGSGEEHWQTYWEKAQPSMRRFAPGSWDNPDLADRIASLDRAICDTNQLLFWSLTA